MVVYYNSSPATLQIYHQKKSNIFNKQLKRPLLSYTIYELRNRSVVNTGQGPKSDSRPEDNKELLS